MTGERWWRRAWRRFAYGRERRLLEPRSRPQWLVRAVALGLIAMGWTGLASLSALVWFDVQEPVVNAVSFVAFTLLFVGGMLRIVAASLRRSPLTLGARDEISLTS